MIVHWQGYNVLAVQTRAFSKKRILETGCGTGFHSYLFMNAFAQEGTALFMGDLSTRMLSKAKT